jgi:hypothetical protein
VYLRAGVTQESKEHGRHRVERAAMKAATYAMTHPAAQRAAVGTRACIRAPRRSGPARPGPTAETRPSFPNRRSGSGGKSSRHEPDASDRRRGPSRRLAAAHCRARAIRGRPRLPDGARGRRPGRAVRGQQRRLSHPRPPRALAQGLGRTGRRAAPSPEPAPDRSSGHWGRGSDPAFRIFTVGYPYITPRQVGACLTLPGHVRRDRPRSRRSGDGRE